MTDEERELLLILAEAEALRTGSRMDRQITAKIPMRIWYLVGYIRQAAVIARVEQAVKDVFRE